MQKLLLMAIGVLMDTLISQKFADCLDSSQRKKKMTFYFYNTDEERLIGTFVAQNWAEAIKMVRLSFDYPKCNTVLRLTPHEYWA